MTEAEWLACDDPQRMLPFLQVTMSQRKLRLFACACLRRVWDLIDGEASRAAAEAAERFADGELSQDERAAAFRLASREASGWSNCCGVVDAAISSAASAAAYVAADEATFRREAASAGERADDFLATADGEHEEEWPGVLALAAADSGAAAECAVAAWGEAFSRDEMEEYSLDWERRAITAGAARAAKLGIHAVTKYEEEEALRMAVQRAENAAQAKLLHDIFGNPFRPLTLEPPPVAVPLSRAAYDERLLPSGEIDPVRLSVLADALEESGAADVLVAHLRSPGPHVRGCWVLDAILGKE